MRFVVKTLPIALCIALVASLSAQGASAKVPASVKKTLKKQNKKIKKLEAQIKGLSSQQAQAVNGKDGAAGSKGDTGPQGDKGAKGSKGDKGLQGDIGPEPDINDLTDLITNTLLSFIVAPSDIGTASGASKLVQTGASGVLPGAALGLSVGAYDTQFVDPGQTASAYCPKGSFAVGSTIGTGGNTSANPVVRTSYPTTSATLGSGWTVTSSTASNAQFKFEAVCLQTDLYG